MHWFLLLMAAGFTVYRAIVSPKLNEFRLVADILARIDAAGLSRWQKIRLWLLGQKTWLLGCAGIFVTVAPDLLDQLHLVDFTALFTTEIALKISAVITLLMTVTHILGLVTAVKIVPKMED